MNSDASAGGKRQLAGSGERLVHEALLYSGLDDFVQRVDGFIREGVEADEPVLVMVPGHKIGPLRDSLGSDGHRIGFADMTEVGRNPGRIISKWRDFCGEHLASGRRVRGVGEPIWAARTPEELVEAQRHEALINLALVDANAWVVCPYDMSALDSAVIDEAYRSHPILSYGDLGITSDTYRPRSDVDRPFDDPLPEAPPGAESMLVTIDALSSIRHRLSDLAAAFGIDPDRSADFVLAVNEVMSNGYLHGMGPVIVRTWTDHDALVCEVRDDGRIDEVLAGRRRPELGDPSGYGLWIANELCDLVQLRSGDGGSVVRMRIRRR